MGTYNSGGEEEVRKVPDQNPAMDVYNNARLGSISQMDLLKKLF